MKTKQITQTAAFLAIGLALHAFTPSLLGSMKPDFLLSMLFLQLFHRPKLKEALVIALVFGIASAMTTGFPGGQVPNLIDKLVTTLFFITFLKLAKRLPRMLQLLLGSALGTLVSGTVFLISAQLITQQSILFGALFAGIVLPATAVNSFFVTLIGLALAHTPLRRTIFAE